MSSHGRRSGLLADLVDPLLSRPAVIVGGLPPRGRDLDLLVADEDEPVLRHALVTAGFDDDDGEWVRLVETGGQLRADVVDVSTGSDWSLPPSETRWLRESGRPLPGWAALQQPPPHAALLLLALRDVAADPLSARHLSRVREAVAEEPSAFALAGRRAPAWQVTASLRALEVRALGRRPGLAVRYASVRESQRRGRRARPAARLRALAHAVLTPSGLRSSPDRRVILRGGTEDRRARLADELLAPLQDLGHMALRCPGDGAGRVRPPDRGRSPAGRLVVCTGGHGPVVPARDLLQVELAAGTATRAAVQQVRAALRAR